MCVYIFERLSDFKFFHYFSLGPSFSTQAGQSSFEKQVLRDQFYAFYSRCYLPHSL